jgi:hypothetical protein
LLGLVSRLEREDSIAQFERAAQQRFEEASLLYHGPRLYSAIYLYGYAIEMWLKAAFFHNEGVIANVAAPLTQADRERAWVQRVAAGAPNRRANQHDVEVWAYLLIYARRTAGIHQPYIPLVESTIQSYASIVHNHWDVKMRYQHLELVTSSEANAVRMAGEWFAANYASL